MTEKKYSDAEIERVIEWAAHLADSIRFADPSPATRWPGDECADMLRQLLAERNERQAAQTSTDPEDKGCSCNDPRCGYDAYYGNPLRTAQLNQAQPASHSARGAVSEDFTHWHAIAAAPKPEAAKTLSINTETSTRVYVCSNTKCGAVYRIEPFGHCPTCIKSNGSGWSTMPKDVL